jgi:hypothetical protein
MKLRDIALWTTQQPKTYAGSKVFYNINWVIKGNKYMLETVSAYTDWIDTPLGNKIYAPTTYCTAYLSAVDISASPTGLNLSLDNDILIGYDYILVQSNSDLYDEHRITEKQNFFIYKDDFTETQIGNMRWYTLALFNTKERRFENHLRDTFDYLINPQPPKVGTISQEKTLEEKIDEVIDELTTIQRRKAIKKLKRMLDERL